MDAIILATGYWNKRMYHSTVRPLTQTPPAYSRRTDNSFASARDLGSLSPGFGSARLRTKGTVSSSDKADFFKFSLLPGASLSGDSSTRYNIKGAAVRVRTFVGFQGQLVPSSSFVVKSGETTRDARREGFTNSERSPIVFYFKLSRIRENAAYQITFNPVE